MLSALITGIGGFVGSHLSTHLHELGWQVYGLDQRGGNRKHVFYGDLADRHTFQAALSDCKPDILFHLGGLIKSHQPEDLYRANVLGTLALLESLVETEWRPIVIVASSSAVYGSGSGARPLSEKFKPRPVTHYAVSKLAQELVALHYLDAVRLPVMVLRMFNLIGPGQSPHLACSAFARQIALAEVHGGDEVVTGDLGARRDFIDVRDAVRAFALVAEKGKAGEVYNVCSGQAVFIRDCLEEMLSLSQRPLKIRMDAEKIQKHDVSIQVGNAHKLHQITGWSPQIHLRKSLSDLLVYWRQRVKSGLE
jgi:GDP-4-dehydro-6-deoxy-D-mannose reductase